MGRRSLRAPLLAAGLLLVLAGAADAQSLTVQSLRRNPVPRPSGGPLTITASAQGATSAVSLVYVINYGEEVTLPMSASGNGSYAATIPAAPPGTMVRWYVLGTDGQGRTARDPVFKNNEGRQYYGTIVEDAAERSDLPAFELYCKDEKAPFDSSTKTSPGVPKNRTAAPGCSLYHNGSFYDNIVVRRQGESSLNWPKPKIRVESGKQGKLFAIGNKPYRIKEFKLNSEWAEPGENTFMRETLAWETFRQMGVDTVTSFQSQVFLNGKYFGKYAFIELWQEDSLGAAGYTVAPKPGPFFKSESGEYSNLRWDIPPDQVQFYYSDEFKSGASAALVELGRGLAGGDALPRSKWLFDGINLPKTINMLAAQTVVLNPDRCTKNFYVYNDPSSQQWAMLTWDIEQSFANDRGLGGGPAPDYCVLACEQWNSPLYCDHAHPQDLSVKTPWGLITTQLNFGPGGSAAAGRKLLQGAANGGGDGSGTTSGTAANGASAPGLSLPANSSIAADYDVDQTKKGPTVTGAPGTFNYLVDAIMSVPRTRAMYMRRVRTLMDAFIPTGRLQALVTAEYGKIKEAAKRDNAKWGNPGDPDRGYQSLITEQLPLRKDQLYNKYGPKGDTPLIPEAQAPGLALSIGSVAAGGNGYVQVLNSNDAAVDVSGWKLNGGGVSFTFVPGTVIPAKDSVYVAAGSIAAFKSRGSGPSGKQGLFVVGPLSGTPDGTSSISITSA